MLSVHIMICICCNHLHYSQGTAVFFIFLRRWYTISANLIFVCVRCLLTINTAPFALWWYPHPFQWQRKALTCLLQVGQPPLVLWWYRHPFPLRRKKLTCLQQVGQPPLALCWYRQQFPQQREALTCLQHVAQLPFAPLTFTSLQLLKLCKLIKEPWSSQEGCWQSIYHQPSSLTHCPTRTNCSDDVHARLVTIILTLKNYSSKYPGRSVEVARYHGCVKETNERKKLPTT